MNGARHRILYLSLRQENTNEDTFNDWFTRDQFIIISKVWNDAQRIRKDERVSSSKALRRLILDINK